VVGEHEPQPGLLLEVEGGVLDLLLWRQDRIRLDGPGAVEITGPGEPDRPLQRRPGRGGEEHPPLTVLAPQDRAGARHVGVVGPRRRRERRDLALFGPRAARRGTRRLEGHVGRGRHAVGRRRRVLGAEVEQMPVVAVLDRDAVRGAGAVGTAGRTEPEHRSAFGPPPPVRARRQAGEPPVRPRAVVVHEPVVLDAPDDDVARAVAVAAARAVPVPEHDAGVRGRQAQRAARRVLRDRRFAVRPQDRRFRIVQQAPRGDTRRGARTRHEQLTSRVARRAHV
jgi:hypothetical protein